MFHIVDADKVLYVITDVNSGLYWTVFTQNRDTAVPAEGNGNLQTLICVLVARPRWCPTLSNPVPWQNWMAAYLSYTLQIKAKDNKDHIMTDSINFFNNSADYQGKRQETEICPLRRTRRLADKEVVVAHTFGALFNSLCTSLLLAMPYLLVITPESRDNL